MILQSFGPGFHLFCLKKRKKRNPKTIKEKALPVNSPSVFVPFDSLWEHADCFCLIEKEVQGLIS